MEEILKRIVGAVGISLLLTEVIYLVSKLPRIGPRIKKLLDFF